MGEVEYHGRQITASTDILAQVLLGTPEHGQPNVGVVGQAAVLEDSWSVDSRDPGAHEASHQEGQEPQVHGTGWFSL